MKALLIYRAMRNATIGLGVEVSDDADGTLMLVAQALAGDHLARAREATTLRAGGLPDAAIIDRCLFDVFNLLDQGDAWRASRQDPDAFRSVMRQAMQPLIAERDRMRLVVEAAVAVFAEEDGRDPDNADPWDDRLALQLREAVDAYRALK